MPPRCLLVDDNDAFLQTASLLLEREGLTVVGVASTIAQALGQVRALRPDLILVDIRLGEESGFDLARLLARDDLHAEVILISSGAEADYAELIDDSPAAGFLAKSELSLRGIRRILRHTPLTKPPPRGWSASGRREGSCQFRPVAASRRVVLASSASREYIMIPPRLFCWMYWRLSARVVWVSMLQKLVPS